MLAIYAKPRATYRVAAVVAVQDPLEQGAGAQAAQERQARCGARAQRPGCK